MTVASGETVVVPWGLGQVEATVLEAYDTGAGPRVRVCVPVLGPDGEVLDSLSVTLRASEVQVASASPRP